MSEDNKSLGLRLANWLDERGLVTGMGASYPLPGQKGKAKLMTIGLKGGFRWRCRSLRRVMK